MSNITVEECPKLNNWTSNPNFITIDTINNLFLSSYDRRVGTVVNVSCAMGQEFYGDTPLTCLKNLEWSGSAKCRTPPSAPKGITTKTQIIISLSSIGGLLVLLTIIGIICSLVRRHQKNKDDNYKYMKNRSFYNSTNSLKEERPKYNEFNDAAFYGPQSYPPRSRSWSALHLLDPHESIRTKRIENVHMTPISLPRNKSEWEVMEATLPRLPSTTSLDSTPSNLKKKIYDFEEFNVYALRQGRDPFLWRPVVSNMRFDN